MYHHRAIQALVICFKHARSNAEVWSRRGYFERKEVATPIWKTSGVWWKRKLPPDTPSEDLDPSLVLLLWLGGYGLGRRVLESTGGVAITDL
jgi:hypothetical protein